MKIETAHKWIAGIAIIHAITIIGFLAFLGIATGDLLTLAMAFVVLIAAVACYSLYRYKDRQISEWADQQIATPEETEKQQGNTLLSNQPPQEPQTPPQAQDKPA